MVRIAHPRAAKPTAPYSLRCRIADRERGVAGDREIVCRAFGDSAVEHAPPGTPVTLSVTGHLRHVRLEVHRIGETSAAAPSARVVAAVAAVRALGGMVSMK